MNPRRLIIAGLILCCATLFSIFMIDGITALTFSERGAANQETLAPAMNLIEWIFGFHVSKFATGAVILIAGLLLFPSPRMRPTAWGLLFLGSAHLISRLIAGMLKNVFLRARPYDAVADGTWTDRFFIEGGSSFPSGHAAHFWALFFGVAVAFPRLRIPTLILAIFVSFARIATHDHYPGDVLASAAIAALVSGTLAWSMAPRFLRKKTAVTAEPATIGA